MCVIRKICCFMWDTHSKPTSMRLIDLRHQKFQISLFWLIKLLMWLILNYWHFFKIPQNTACDSKWHFSNWSLVTIATIQQNSILQRCYENMWQSYATYIHDISIFNCVINFPVPKRCLDVSFLTNYVILPGYHGNQYPLGLFCAL